MSSWYGDGRSRRSGPKDPLEEGRRQLDLAPDDPGKERDDEQERDVELDRDPEEPADAQRAVHVKGSPFLLL
jgi:hypothetical protein